MCSYKRQKWTAFVLSQRHESIKKLIYLALTHNQCIQHQPNTNAHNINPKSMLIATDFLLVGFPSLKTFILRSMPLACHSARSRRRSRRIHHPIDNPRPLGEGGPSQTKVGEGQKKSLSPTPHPFGGYLFPREKIFLRLFKQWILQLRASPACRMTWGWGERLGKNPFIKMCSYKRLKMNCICSLWRHESIKNQFT